MLEDRLCPTGVTFGPAINWDAGGGPDSVAVGDFNGDGRPDLAAANPGSDTVSVLIGNGSGGFAAPVPYAAGDSPASVAVGDFNGDGRPDLAVANFNSTYLSVLLGDGNGHFGTAPSVSGFRSASVAVGDFNGDGHADLAATNMDTNEVSVLIGNGIGGFSVRIDRPVGATPVSVAVGDFNGDGHADLAAANFNSTYLSVLVGDGSGNFGTAPPVTVGAAANSVVAGDFDGDGREDLAVTNNFGDKVKVLLGNEGGGFAAPVQLDAGFGTGDVAVGDFNGDGRPDLAVANFNSASLGVLLNTTPANRPPAIADQTFAVNENMANGTVVGTVAASDLDADQMLAYQITTGNAVGAFTINGSTGQIIVANSAALDYETTPVFTLTVQVTDNGSPARSGTATITINLNNVNEAPVNSAPTFPQAVAKNKLLTFSRANGNAISIADRDSGTALIQVSLTVLRGNLTLAGTGGLTFLVGDGGNDGTMTFRGTVAAINAALDGLKYAPAKGYTGSDSLTITTNDLGSGFGDPQTDTDLVAILVEDKK